MWTRILFGAFGALSIGMAGSQASAQEVFGSRLNHQLTPPQFCDQNDRAKICSWVLETGQNNAARTRAPRDGVIGKIRLMACSPGTFVLQIAQAQPQNDRAKVSRSGPLINYVGDNRNCNTNNFQIEEFTVNVPVKQGDFLAVATNRVAFLYNASGDGSILFAPPLPDRGPIRAASEDVDGDGFLMIQAVLKP
jgi:hypothetical protein